MLRLSDGPTLAAASCVVCFIACCMQDENCLKFSKLLYCCGVAIWTYQGGGANGIVVITYCTVHI